MDPGYNADQPAARSRATPRCCTSRSPFLRRTFSMSPTTSSRSPCYLCARMRRGYLYSKAQSLGCNKIALGHHFSDVVETTVMGMFYGSQLQAMPPKLRSHEFPGHGADPPHVLHPRGRHPRLEAAIMSWNLSSAPAALPKTAPCATMAAAAPSGRRSRSCCAVCAATIPISKRSIFNSIHSVNLDMMPGYKTGGVLHSFLENYDGHAGGNR